MDNFIKYRVDSILEQIKNLQTQLDFIRSRCPHENTRANALYWESSGSLDCLDCGKEQISLDREKFIETNSIKLNRNERSE